MLMGMFDCVDDTVLITKTILSVSEYLWTENKMFSILVIKVFFSFEGRPLCFILLLL